MKAIRIFLISVISLFGSLKSWSQTPYFPPVNSSSWESVTPESLGWCTENIDSLYNFLESRNTKAFIMLKNGRIVLEKYFGTFTTDSLWYWASAGKTLTSMLVGIAQHEGYLSIDSSVSKYIGQGWTSLSSEKEKLIKVRNQITMTSGLEDMVPDPDCTTPDCLKYAADAGTRWAYHNAAYTLLDPVLSSATGMDFNLYYNSRIRNKTGMDGVWLYLGYNHIYFSKARSMARYGLLLSAKGIWDGNPVLDDTVYFHNMINSSQELNLSYGYLTWLNGKGSYMLPQSQFVFTGSLCPDAPDDMFSAMGKNGQLINVVPSQGLVLVRMGEAPDNQYELANYFNNLLWLNVNNVICNTHGVGELQRKYEFQVYPNPASSKLYIVSAAESVKYKAALFDMNGRLKLLSENQNEMDISAMPAGVYCLVIIADGIRSRHFISIHH